MMNRISKKGYEKLIEQMRQSLVDNPESKYASFSIGQLSLSDNRIADLTLRLEPIKDEDVKKYIGSN